MPQVKNLFTWSQNFLYFVETSLEHEKKKFKILYNNILSTVIINGRLSCEDK